MPEKKTAEYNACIASMASFENPLLLNPTLLTASTFAGSLPMSAYGETSFVILQSAPIIA